MALKTVFDLKDNVAGILSGMDLGTVADLNGAFVRGASNLCTNADVPEASGIQNITLYSGVYDYLCDQRIYGTAINDIRPVGISRNPANDVIKVNQEDFDRAKKQGYLPSGTMATFEYNNGVPTIRIVAPFPVQQVNIDQMSSIGNTPNSWVASGTASGLTQDITSFYQAPASLRFNMTTGTGILTKTLQSPISMSSYQGFGVAFLAIEIPPGATASNLTSISLKLGSSSSAYNSVSSTQGFLGAWVSGQFLLVAFDFSSASTVGSPNWASIQYAQISMVVAGAFTNFRVGGLFMSLPSQAQILYQSSAIFLAVGSTTPTTTITASTDTIILTDPAYNIYQYECALAVLQNTGASASDDTRQGINQTLHGTRARNGAVIQLGLYDIFRGKEPSQQLSSTGSYYDNAIPYGQNTN